MQRRTSLFRTFCIVGGPQDYSVLTNTSSRDLSPIVCLKISEICNRRTVNWSMSICEKSDWFCYSQDVSIYQKADEEETRLPEPLTAAWKKKMACNHWELEAGVTLSRLIVLATPLTLAYAIESIVPCSQWSDWREQVLTWTSKIRVQSVPAWPIHRQSHQTWTVVRNAG